MKYVKIKAGTYNEAMMKLKMEYGDDAIPVSHKYVKEGGILRSKFFAKNMVELTAAIPEKRTLAKEKSLKKSIIDFTIGENDLFKKREAVKSAVGILERETGTTAAQNDHINLNTLPQKNAGNGTASLTKDKLFSGASLTMPKEDSYNNIRKLEKEFQEIKDALNLLLEKQGDQTSAAKKCSLEDETMKIYLEILENNDFDLEDRISIIEEVRRTISPEDLKDKYKIEKSLKYLLKDRVLTSGPIKKGTKKKVIMFIGPTGVGKTTTMAKLGAIYALRENQNVSFITIDTYRIAATEQLKKYAGIMKIPIHVVNDQKSFKDVIDNEKSQIIMVDTSGRSHKNELKLSEIKSYADMVEYDFEKILCVCANTKKGDLDNIFKAFGKINFDSIIITKVDESSYIGNVVNIAEKYKKPIAYFTNGQEVPNDINVAEPNKIIDMIIGVENTI